MEKILHQLIVVYPIIYKVFNIPGGCLGFLPSTVCLKRPKKMAPVKTCRASTTCNSSPLISGHPIPGTVALALKSDGGHRGGRHPSSHKHLQSQKFAQQKGTKLDTMNGLNPNTINTSDYWKFRGFRPQLNSWVDFI